MNLEQVSDEVGRECGNRTWETEWAVIEKLNKRRKLGVERKRLKNENENKLNVCVEKGIKSHDKSVAINAQS